MIITLTGTPGCGKSTLGKLLAETLGYEFMSIGDLRRRFAQEKGITLAELNRRSETGEEDTDTDFDEYQRALGARKDRLVVDSRLGWHFIPKSLKLFLDADEDVRAQRLLQRPSLAEKATTAAEAKEMNRLRIESDRKRYLKYYGVDPYRTQNHDLVLDSSTLTPDQLVEEVLDRFPQLRAAPKTPARARRR